MRVVTGAEMRALDQDDQEVGISSLVLMENAGTKWCSFFKNDLAHCRISGLYFGQPGNNGEMGSWLSSPLKSQKHLKVYLTMIGTGVLRSKVNLDITKWGELVIY